MKPRDALSKYLDQLEKLIDRLHEGDIGRAHFDRLNEEAVQPLFDLLERLETT